MIPESDVKKNLDEFVAGFCGAVVAYPDSLATFPQRPHDVTVNETGSAGHEIGCGQCSSLCEQVFETNLTMQNSLEIYPAASFWWAKGKRVYKQHCRFGCHQGRDECRYEVVQDTVP